MNKIASDLHIHSIASGHAFNTIDEIIDYSSKSGYSLIGISDHGPSMEGAPHHGYFEMMVRLPKTHDSMRILYGCEANILDTQGNIDIKNHLVDSLDYVMAGIHKRVPYNGKDNAEHTEAIISAIRRGYVDIISHPVTPFFITDGEAIVREASIRNVLIEANKSTMLTAIDMKRKDVIDAYGILLHHAQSYGVPILFGSDAHHISEMGLSDSEELRLWEYFHINVNAFLNIMPDQLFNIIRQRKIVK